MYSMFQLFREHPAENLRADIPSLAEFDNVYVNLKEVTDKMFELNTGKVRDFYKYISQDEESVKNSLIFYIKRRLSS